MQRPLKVVSVKSRTCPGLGSNSLIEIPDRSGIGPGRVKTDVPTWVDEVLQRDEAFSEDTRSGKHDKTAQYWMCYIEMIHLYHEFIRSIRTGDLDLYIYCLPKLAAFFLRIQSPNLHSLAHHLS